MKTFNDLIEEVQKPGRCHHCGGCVTFCSAINYGALKLDSEGKPVYSDIEKCIECGICYMICPEITDLDEEIKRQAEWKAPVGRTIELSILRSKDQGVRSRATDGGAVTGLLVHLLEKGRINGAIVSRMDESGRHPWLATTKKDIIEAAGTHFDHSHGVAEFGDIYSTFSPSIWALSAMLKKGMTRVAFVGTPCQINTIRKMQVLGIVPADSIDLCLGLFCSGNYTFTMGEFRQIEKKYDFKYDDVEKINIKDQFQFLLSNGKTKHVLLPDLEFIKREACKLCDDFSAEYADISFGGLGAEQGWTTVITRTPLGRAILAYALEESLESFPYKENPKCITLAKDKILMTSRLKKEHAAQNRID